MSVQHAPVPRERLLYRLRWRLRYALLQVYGPAQLGSGDDPREQMLRDREDHRRSLLGRGRSKLTSG